MVPVASSMAPTRVRAGPRPSSQAKGLASTWIIDPMAASGRRRWRAWRWRRRRFGGRPRARRILEFTQLLAEMAVVEAGVGRLQQLPDAGLDVGGQAARRGLPPGFVHEA